VEKTNNHGAKSGYLKGYFHPESGPRSVVFYLFLIKEQNISAACYSITAPSAST
jgi:hypothetical protein